MKWPGPLRRLARPWLLVSVGALLAAYLLLGAFALPRYIQGAIPEYVATHLKRKASVGEVRFNPLLFKLELRDFELAEADDRPIAGFRHLLVDFELSSLLRWAWTFSSIVLDGLELRPDVAPDGRFNFAALADSLPKSEGPREATAPPRVVLQHFELTDAAVTFSDRSGSRPRFDTLRPLALELRDLTTLPDRRGPYNVTARLPGGGTLSWRGEMSLQPIFSFGEVSLKGARPASVWRFIQDRVKFDEPAGEVAVDLRYRAAYTDGTPELAVDDLRLTATDLALALKGAKEPFFALKTAAVTGGRFDLAQRELRLPSVELRGGVVGADVDEDGVINLQQLAPEPVAPVSVSPTAPAQPWRVKLDSLRVGEIALRYRDFSRATPIALGVGALELGFAAALEVGAGDPRVTVDNLAVTLSRVTLGPAAAGEPLVSLDTVGLEGGAFELHQESVAARRVSVKGGLVQVTRDEDGTVRLLEIVKEGERTRSRKELKAALREARSAGKPWRFALDAFDIEGLKIALAAHGFGQPVGYDIDPLTLAVKNIRSEGRTPITLDATLRVAQGGSLRVSGDTNTAGNRATLRTTLQGLSLRPLQPAVSSRTALVLNSGEVSATIQAQYRAIKDRTELRAGGSASVDNLQLAEAGSGERFLEWKSVSASGINFSLAPDRLAIAEVAVRALGAKVLVNKDRSVNLALALSPPGGAQPAAAAPPPTAETAKSGFPVSIERVSVDNAAVDFSDLSLVLPFAAKIQELGGNVLGLSSDRASRAVAKLEGRVDEFGLARIDGSLATFDPTAFLDLHVAFRNIEMSPFSAYSVTFAGRRIAAGRLGLDLQYKIDKGTLAGDNKLELNKLTLGERVETPGAINLPLDLAVALLTDAQGRIALAVPVKGNVNDPQFSYGHLVWQAITTALTNIATAPFRALLGSGGDAVENIAFDAGRAALLPPEREKLKRVADALEQRPQLKLLVEGQHSEADRAALRRRDVARAISLELESDAAGDEPPPVNARDGKTQRAMEALFVKRASDQAFAEFIAQTEKARGKPVERVGALSALAGRASEDGAFYDALLERLNTTAPLPGDALDQLAFARGAAVAEHLEKTLSVSPTRVERKAPAAGDTERAKLGLDAATPKPL